MDMVTQENIIMFDGKHKQTGGVAKVLPLD